MRKTVAMLAAVSMLVFAAAVVAQESTPSQHVTAVPSGLKWGDPPPVFEKAASFTVIAGNPMEAGPYVVRLKMPAGYKIAPHWHPTDENVTVISGTFEIGMGETFDKATMKSLPAGGFVLLPADMRHYAMAKTAAIVQVHGMGPFKLTYGNPAADPSTKSASK